MEVIGVPLATVGDALRVTLVHLLHHWSFDIHWQRVHMSQLWSPQLASIGHLAFANVVWSDKIIWHTIILLHVGDVGSVVVVVLVEVLVVVSCLLVEGMSVPTDIIDIS